MRLFAAIGRLCGRLCILPATIFAQERPSTILVLGASGSTWGRIDGINRIIVARDVIADLLADFPADQNLGLTVRDNRVRGECTDIETVVAPGPGNRAAIADAADTIRPVAPDRFPCGKKGLAQTRTGMVRQTAWPSSGRCHARTFLAKSPKAAATILRSGRSSRTPAACIRVQSECRARDRRMPR